MRYFKTLLIALLGRNPYRLELEQARDEYKRAAENMKTFRDLYYMCKEKEDGKAARLIDSLQQLVEMLRQHIREKDEQIEQMRADYRQQVVSYERRLGDYSLANAELRKKAGAE